MHLKLIALASAVCVTAAVSAVADDGWDVVLEKARGQTVYFNAWAGDGRINDYIAWAGDQVKDRYGVELRHVKIQDISETVARILAEKTAGRTDGGSADLVWINGENFARMKQGGLLHGPFTNKLPHFKLVDTVAKPTTVIDFTVPTDSLEAPWGMAQVVFIYDQAVTPKPPGDMAAFLAYARANPGRLTYPQPPDFMGSTFLKQALLEMTPDAGVLANPVSEAVFDRATAPLWTWLDAIHPYLWRKGKLFPKNGPAARQLLSDGEIDITISFHPGEASSLIDQDLLPSTARTFVFEAGTLGNTHFVAIPFNATAKEGAMVVADFLMSPEAQARKLDPTYWGDMTVLAMERLSAVDRKRFAALKLGIATLAPDALGAPLPEPHPSWMERIEKEWRHRFER